ncbi:MAG: hypothetical protein HQM10_14660 [Candidatus Riflebacteria bacterium]|nr:hypothetical protein [Candidatus Riflebacteria bacterium]
MGRHRFCELPFCNGVISSGCVSGCKRRCDNDRDIHLHRIISENVKKIMRYSEEKLVFTAADVTRDVFGDSLDKNQKGSMYRLFQAMVRENYLLENGKRGGLKLYKCIGKNGPRFPNKKVKSEDVVIATCEPMEEPKPVQPSKYQLQVKLREFVFMKNGSWNHDDWLWLISRTDIREFGESESIIGDMLEEEKRRFWSEGR